MNLKEKHHQIRVLFALIVCALGLIGLGVRLHWIQMEMGEQLNSRGQRQHKGLIRLPAERGRILDRGEQLLALNSERPSLRVYGKTWKSSPQAVKQLGEIVNVEPEILQQRIDQVCQRIKKSAGQLRSGVLLYNISAEQQEKIEALELPGLKFSSGTGRVYPNGTLAASVLGFVGLEGKGLEGIECFGESYLRGACSSVPTLRDGLGTNLFYTDVTKDQSSRGADIILALDQYIQFLAEKELEKIGQKYEPKWASIVVMEPYSGELLAVANWPTYDPNHVEFSRSPERKNFAVCEAFEPGSTIKTFTLAAALEDQVMTPDTPVYCEKGRYRIHRHTLRDDIHAYEWLTMEEVLAYSSNIGAVKIAQMIGPERLHEVLHSFGFGQLAGISFPGESPGLLRPVSGWSGLSIAAIPFGQEMQTTVIGLARAYSAIANGGMLHTPKLILGYRNPRTGEICPQQYPEPKRVLSAPTTLGMRRMLTAVTEYGGGEKAQVPGFHVAGKTGTAQVYDPEIKKYSRNKHVASFVGFLPAEDPRVVITVVVNQPKDAKYGNLVAGPAFSTLGEELMRYLEVFPTDVEKKQEIAERLFTADKIGKNDSSAFIPDYARQKDLVLGMTMREAYEALKLQGLQLDFEGSGIALLQNDSPGEATAATVQVQFYQPTRLDLN